MTGDSSEHCYTCLLGTNYWGQQMYYRTDRPIDYEYRRVSGKRKSLPENVRQEFRRETKHIVRRLRFLLPKYQMCVGATQYAKAKNELMLLAACCNDDLLDIYALEQSLTNLTRLQEGFAFVFHRRLGVKQGTSLVGRAAHATV